MPAEAAANGDYLLPTVFHSVQSRRVPAHQQRLRHAADGAVRREQPPAARARPALRVVEQPPRGGRRHRHVHRVRHQGPPQGPRVLRRDVAPLDLRRLLPQLPRAAGEVRPGHPARPHRGSVEPDLEQGLRARSRPVLRHRLARQLLADRPDDRQGLRVVRVQVPGLVRQVRQVVGELQPPVYAERAPPDRRRERRLRVPAPLLDLHGPVPGPRGHGDGRGRRAVAHLLPRGMPLDRRDGLPADLPGPRDAEHGPAHRQARVGDPVPRLELGRRRLRHGLRARRRQDDGRAAAPRPGRPEEDVDARPPAPDAGGAVAERPAQRDDRRRARRPSTPTTTAGSRRPSRPGRRRDGSRLIPERTRGDSPAPGASLPGGLGAG